ncbi:MAG TPA: hypothetical protein K8V32_10930 [Enteractinococcus helveticum]|uniref:Uncharacterized protein n=1 Tax=Enteractinococcus helveticum TaxID=1837282 RepID=A0A921K880_9MICC|nr:hypothetical protein [Enteractinococcus helveticum]HJF15293.1 hypothetical protein [Enteractinococcus helveticum]
MTERNMPFEDPKYFGFPKEARIAHQPGLTDQLMQEIAPLLAADGIDLTNLDDVDLDEFNAAMARAIERRNMELITPVGDREAVTILTLYSIVYALESGTEEQLQKIFASIGPEPTHMRPSAGHLTGVAMETLDKWYTDPSLEDSLQHAKLAFGHAETRAAAEDLQVLARQGRAVQSYGNLLVSHGGLELARAGAYLIYVSIAAIAAGRQLAVNDALTQFLPNKPLSKEHIDNIPVAPEVEQWIAEEERYEDFRFWLIDQYDDQDADEIYELFIGRVLQALDAGLEPDDPDAIQPWLASVQFSLDYQDVMESVHAISSYVAYRVENSVDPSPWIALLESFETDVGGDALAEQFRGIIAAADKVPISDRLAAIGQLPIVDGLYELGQWLATSKPVTTRQVPRRADIQLLAEMVGIQAVGVSAKPEPQDEPTVFEDLMASSSTAPDPQMPYIPDRTTTYSVQSALEIPELMSWWTALETLQVIELTASRVKQGPRAEVFIDEDLSLENAELVVGLWIANVLLCSFRRSHYEIPAAALVINHLISAMAGAVIPLIEPNPDADVGVRITNVSYCTTLRYLRDMGLVQIQHGLIHVPATLYRPLVLGLSTAVQQATELLTDFE